MLVSWGNSISRQTVIFGRGSDGGGGFNHVFLVTGPSGGEAKEWVGSSYWAVWRQNGTTRGEASWAYKGLGL
jgi:hypothetical protein